MREIKFRQPILDGEGNFIRWHYWGFVSSGKFVGVIPPINEAQKNSLRYIGLLDRDNMEIYEADYVLFLKKKGLLPAEHPIKILVKWNEQGMNYNVWKPDDEHELKIVGSIFEDQDKCSKGGRHLWGTDGVHTNVFCKKCFIDKVEP